MNTRQLHYLLTIAERGSLSQAALALGISQPALSKVLTEWDSLCASPLFLRYHRRQIPTALGRKVLEYAETWGARFWSMRKKLWMSKTA